jgi:hypothetical protein
MRLPRFIRQSVARISVLGLPEAQGFLHDYKNGKWELLVSWDTEQGNQDALNMIENMALREGRDAIYVTTLMCQPNCGVFIIQDSNAGLSYRAFWKDLYTAREAYEDTVKRCRKIADKMGFRRPDETV